MTGYVCAPEWKAVPPASYLGRTRQDDSYWRAGEDIRVDVRTVVAKHGVRGLHEVGAEGDLVGHGTGREEEGGLLAGEFGHVGLKGEGGWFVVDIVTQGGLCGIHEHLLGGDCAEGDMSVWSVQHRRHNEDACL